jgi:hypothetical protein
MGNSKGISPARIAQIILSGLLFLTAVSQTQATVPALLFQSSEALDITISAPFGEINRKRDKEVEYPGTLSYVDANGAQVVLDVKLEVRGNYRLQSSICRYSQLWVNIQTGQAKGTLFEGQDKIKLVAQCRDGDRYSEYIVKEHQAYKLFEQLSEYSFATRLLNTTYEDSEKPGEPRTSLGFFIEHQKQLAKRFDMKTVDLNGVPIRELEPVQSSLVALFMYLVGNTDFSLVLAPAGEECCHNAKLMVDENGTYFPVPYDFDSSGYVDTSYAAPPDPALGITTNRQRRFRGYCAQQDFVAGAVQQFQAAREALAAVTADTALVKAGTAKRSTDYLNDFYDTIGTPKDFQRQILDACR